MAWGSNRDPIRPISGVMKNSVFLAFCTMIVATLLAAHILFEKSLDPAKIWKVKLTAVEQSKRDAELQAQVAAHQLADFKQHVATLLPSAIKDLPYENSYPLRQLASVSAKSAKVIEIERASGVFEIAKSAFREQRFIEAIEGFRAVIAKYPESAHLPEAHFLLAESLYQEKDYEAAITTIESMVDAYPENELTGFALLRLGAIFEVENRLEDASEVYKAVLNNFTQGELSRQASTSLKAVNL